MIVPVGEGGASSISMEKENGVEGVVDVVLFGGFPLGIAAFLLWSYGLSVLEVLVEL